MAAIAPWFRLRLPFCGPGFDSQALHLRFFQFVLLKLYRENNENKQKEAGIGPFLKNNITNLAEIFAEYEEAAHRPKVDEASGQLSKKRGKNDSESELFQLQ